MQITRTSPLTGQVRTMEINVTQTQIDEWQKGVRLIQDIMPNISPSDREFIMTGITEEEWNHFMAEVEDE